MALRESARLLSTAETREIYFPWIDAEHNFHPGEELEPIGELIAGQAWLYLAFHDVAEDYDDA